jgi:anti-sigma B factor antagonist
MALRKKPTFVGLNIVIILKIATMETIGAEIDGTTLKIFVKVARLGASTAREFKRECQKIWTSKIHGVWVDLSQVTFLDSSGIGALLSLYKLLPTPNPCFKLLRVQPGVQAMIELLRLHRIFDVEA